MCIREFHQRKIMQFKGIFAIVAVNMGCRSYDSNLESQKGCLVRILLSHLNSPKNLVLQQLFQHFSSLLPHKLWLDSPQVLSFTNALLSTCPRDNFASGVLFYHSTCIHIGLLNAWCEYKPTLIKNKKKK